MNAVSPVREEGADSAVAWPRRIVYVIEDAVDARNRRRFGMDYFLQRGIAVSALEVSAMTHPTVPRDRRGYDAVRDIALTAVADRAAWERAVPSLADADLIVSLVSTGALDPHSIPVYRAIARSGKPYLILSSNAFPGWSRYRGESSRVGRRIFDIARRIGEIDLKRSVVARIRPAWLGIPPASYVVYGGRRSCSPNLLVGPGTREIWAHAMDYEILRDRPAVPAPVVPEAVFIDEFHPFHPDHAGMGLTPPVTPEYYYARLRALFDRIEKELKLRVVVAASPRSDYEKRPGLFGDGPFGPRPVDRGLTADFVKRSRLVIAHRSTAIGLAVMCGKPVLQVAVEKSYLHSSQRPFFDSFAEALGKPIRFIDDPSSVDFSDAFLVRDDLYARYKLDFVKVPESPEKGYWEIVLDALMASGPTAENRSATR